MAETNCECDPTIKKMWGCEKPAQCAVWINVNGLEYYSCPIRFITENSVEWFKEQAYYKEYGTLIRYDELPNLWIEALTTYNRYINEYNNEKISSAERKNNTSKVSPLLSTVRGRNRK